jgi:hypothetical protein
LEYSAARGDVVVVVVTATRVGVGPVTGTDVVSVEVFGG